MALHPGTCIGLSSWWWGAPPKTRLVTSPGKMIMMSLYYEDVLIEEFKLLVAVVFVIGKEVIIETCH